MAFWSSETVKQRVPAEGLIQPYDESRVMRGAYELSAGAEAYITSKSGEKTKLGDGERIVIPPGQFGLLVSKETVSVPSDAMAFLSIKSTTKMQGLINVSGFHVDPGYSNTLKFAVYNAGSQNIYLDQGQAIFLVWFAALDHPTADLYKPRPGLSSTITADDVKRIEGEVASPAELKKQLDKLKDDFDKRIHEIETEADKRIHELETNTDKRVHTVENRMSLVQGVLVALLIAIGVALAKSWIEHPPEKQSVTVPAQPTPADPKVKN
jgi:dCTP deaminase